MTFKEKFEANFKIRKAEIVQKLGRTLTEGEHEVAKLAYLLGVMEAIKNSKPDRELDEFRMNNDLPDQHNRPG